MAVTQVSLLIPFLFFLLNETKSEEGEEEDPVSSPRSFSSAPEWSLVFLLLFLRFILHAVSPPHPPPSLSSSSAEVVEDVSE